MNPTQRRANRAKISPPAEVAATPEIAAEQGGGGFSGMVGRALQAARDRQAAAATRATKPQAPPQSPVPTGPKRGPRRRPTAREQAMQTTQAEAGMRGQAVRQRAGLDQMGATQEEVAAPAVMPGRQDVTRGRGILSRAEQAAADKRAALEATGETGGTRSEVDVTEPSLNEARQRRSRSGRIFRR